MKKRQFGLNGACRVLQGGEWNKNIFVDRLNGSRTYWTQIFKILHFKIGLLMIKIAHHRI